MIKNKKGDIPITILVIGVFVVCVISLTIFSFSILKITDSFVPILFVEEMNSQIERYNLYTSVGLDTTRINSILGIRKDVFNKDYLYLERNFTGSEGLKHVFSGRERMIGIEYYLK